MMFEFRVTNTTSGTIELLIKEYCNILVSGEQIECNKLPPTSHFDDDIGTIMTGITRQGGFYVPAKTPRSDINTITIEFPGAYNAKGSEFTGNYSFSFDITNWVWEPSP